MTACGFVEAGNGLTTEDQFADLALAFGAEHTFALVPVDLVEQRDLLGQHGIEQRRVELGGQIDPFFTLPLTTAQIRHDDPCLLHQGIGFSKQRCATIGQTILRATRSTLLGDTVRVGQRQQRAEPARVIGINDRTVSLAAQVATVLTRQLFGPLHTTLCATCCALGARQQGQATVQIGPGATQNIPLAQQRRDITRQIAQSQRMAAQKQMGDAWMSRQLGHRLAVGRQAARLP